MLPLALDASPGTEIEMKSGSSEGLLESRFHLSVYGSIAYQQHGTLVTKSSRTEEPVSV
jgi:hypothetical protein